MRILLIEDDAPLAQALMAFLNARDFVCECAGSLAKARAMLPAAHWAAVLLDWQLPDGEGLTLLPQLRRMLPDSPVIMLTARDQITDRIRGLDAGADDYLVKPFAFDELSARIRSLLRRDPGRSGAVLEVGDVVVDTARHHARRGDRDLALTAKEFAVLRYFMTRPGEVISQEQLLDHVWDEHADPFTNTVRVTVGTLRRKLTVGDEDPALETVVGSGYRLFDPGVMDGTGG